MEVRFWGVRGSVPSPGFHTARYGGNTSCISIRLEEGRLLILDAGTGIRELGKALCSLPDEIYILLSHVHWDHIQGFPFFGPIYQSGRKISMFPTRLGKTMTCSLLEQMDGAHFPVSPEHLPAQPACITENEIDFLRGRGFDLSKIATNHPGGGYAYRLINKGRSMIYLTDNELDPPYKKTTEFEGFVEFCRGTDLLIHDAQYVERDMPQKRGWGHSLVNQACELAAAAAVKHLVLYHHDPDRTDEELDSLQEQARERLGRETPPVKCTAAYEGLVITL
jgi:phosphoribosyl 1,2-cyclic phosphodiesterase